MKKKKYIVILLVIITIIQILTRIYIGNKKEYFHMDEAYSYGLMNYDKLNIADNEDFKNEWHDKEYYQDYFEVNSDEVKDLSPVYENQKNDVHPPFYYLCLRIFSSFTVDNFTKWSGLALNIMVFAISNLFIYLICKKLFKNPIYAILGCIVNGFSLISLDSSLYIRMYELCNLNILIATYLHLKIYKQKDLSPMDMAGLIISLLIGGLTHYYYFIYVLVLYIICTISAIKKKEKAKLIKYQICMVAAGVIYLIIFPYSISHVLFSNRGIGAGSSINPIQKGFSYLYVISSRFFNNFILLIIPVVALLCWKKTSNGKKMNEQIKLLAIPTIVYFITIAITAPYIESRYVMPIYSSVIILTLYLVKTILNKYWNNKHTLFLTVLLFIITLYSPILTNTNLEFTYQQYNNIAEYVENENLPIIYIWNTQNNRILDDAYLFTLAPKSIILDYNNPTEEIKSIVEETKDFILICNEGVQDEKLKEYGIDAKEYKQRMNACDIWIVRNSQNVS